MAQERPPQDTNTTNMAFPRIFFFLWAKPLISIKEKKEAKNFFITFYTDHF